MKFKNYPVFLLLWYEFFSTKLWVELSTLITSEGSGYATCIYLYQSFVKVIRLLRIIIKKNHLTTICLKKVTCNLLLSKIALWAAIVI